MAQDDSLTGDNADGDVEDNIGEATTSTDKVAINVHTGVDLLII